jgi:hypothetical protein
MWFLKKWFAKLLRFQIYLYYKFWAKSEKLKIFSLTSFVRARTTSYLIYTSNFINLPKLTTRQKSKRDFLRVF